MGMSPIAAASIAVILLAALGGTPAVGQAEVSMDAGAGKAWVMEKSYCAWFASKAPVVKCSERACVERDVAGTASDGRTLYGSKAECDSALAGILSETAAQRARQTDVTKAMADFFGSIGRFFSSLWSK